MILFSSRLTVMLSSRSEMQWPYYMALHNSLNPFLNKPMFFKWLIKTFGSTEKNVYTFRGLHGSRYDCTEHAV